MKYQREKDRRLYESSRIAQENARLSIIKQEEVVQVLAKLSDILRSGLLVSLDTNDMDKPRPAPNLPPSESSAALSSD
jgi:hypothetical protein